MSSLSKEKFCTMPGIEPVRLAGTHGHVVIIGEEPRIIPEIFILEARGKGCITEAELEALKARFTAAPVNSSEQDNNLPLTNLTNTPVVPIQTNVADKERFEKIILAVIDLVNSGDPASFDNSGKPKVKALAEKCGFEVSGMERDAAFEAASK